MIRATVVSIADLPGEPEVDNGPDWWVATVMPRNTLRGPVDIAPLGVRFQSGQSERCHEMPRLVPGEERLLLVQPDDVTGHPGPALVVFDPLDVQPTTALERLRSLISAGPIPPML